MYIATDVYVHEDYGLQNSRRLGNVVLLVQEDDFEKTLIRSEVTHEGAFGQWGVDYKLLPPDGKVAEVISSNNLNHSLRGVKWIAVTKFPADLARIPKIEYKPLDVPVPVGTYLLKYDTWVNNYDPVYWVRDYQDSSRGFTKLRLDSLFEKPYHILMGGDIQTETYAAISSEYFIEGLWGGPTREEKERVNIFVKRMREELYVHIFPCYGQHHLFVFHSCNATDLLHYFGVRCEGIRGYPLPFQKLEIADFIKIGENDDWNTKFQKILLDTCLGSKAEGIRQWWAKWKEGFKIYADKV